MNYLPSLPRPTFIYGELKNIKQDDDDDTFEKINFEQVDSALNTPENTENTESTESTESTKQRETCIVTNMTTSNSNVSELEAQIAAQGKTVADLKAIKADEGKVKAVVDKLLELKNAFPEGHALRPVSRSDKKKVFDTSLEETKAFEAYVENLFKDELNTYVLKKHHKLKMEYVFSELYDTVYCCNKYGKTANKLHKLHKLNSDSTDLLNTLCNVSLSLSEELFDTCYKKTNELFNTTSDLFSEMGYEIYVQARYYIEYSGFIRRVMLFNTMLFNTIFIFTFNTLKVIKKF